jgi:hypothetical protein
MRTLEIPASVHEIDASAFRLCKELQSVTILNIATLVDPTAFSDCPKLYLKQ